MGKLSALLCYHGKHQLFFGRGGYSGKFVELNPMVSGSHNKEGKKTKRVYEPTWLWLLRKKWFMQTETQICPQRNGMSHPSLPKTDNWLKGTDGYRTCSYCGSIHFDDLMDIAKKTIDDPRYGIEGTTKNYKVYVRQPGVRNASEGAIKYYKDHTPASVSPEDEKLFREAMMTTSKRFNEMLGRK